VAVITIGAVSFALLQSTTDEEQQSDPLVQPTTAVVTQSRDDTSAAQSTEPIAMRAATPAPAVNGFEIDTVLGDIPPVGQVEQEPAELPQAQQQNPLQKPNLKILNFEKSRDALRAFCRATSADELLKYVQKPEVNEASIRSYFEKHGPVCFELRELIHGQTTLSKDNGRYWSSFLVQTNKNPRGFAVTMQETDTGPRLSWPAFVQHHDGLFEDYLDQHPTDPQVFCANISRGYSIDPNAPDPKRFHCFRIRGSESPRGKVKAYVDRSTYLGEQLERTVDWDGEVPVTVELQWVKDEANPDMAPTLYIREVLEYLW
jgi:hypothetical protein